jgi:16S rRNA (uracil1498-N3)-methyltransferase
LFDFIIEKATELGVARIVPLVSERVISRPDERDRQTKTEKWQHTAIEAIKQSGQTWMPRVESPLTPNEFLAREESFDLALVGSLQSDARHARAWFQEYADGKGHGPRTMAIWVGPEGDFSPAEMEKIKAAGVKPISLGPLILRCETAAMSLLAIANYELQAGRPPNF